MLTKITGVLNRVLEEEARLQVGPFEYQVLIPEFVRRQIQTSTGEEVTFHTLEYIEGNQNSNKMIPRKIGFSSELELEFFELFCTVDKIGVKKALKAMGRPIRELANAIQRLDVKWLTTMPGIGKTTAEQIIATLKTKVTKFALLGEQPSSADDGKPAKPAVNATVFEDAYTALMGLGLSPADARDRLDVVLKTGKEYKDVGDIINECFKKKTER
ncbi:Holliday junction branch migration protein RuvA [Zavarzinella formosa]|uniref:Holliday junction branch migration protein RuvA n=1 Tax=Zavarzinella formosa TaxID=360055 RepID=UPI0002DAE0AC|nr:Holliday junction branch migration protein RuvA [Zavarzinella formosa]